MFQHGSGAPPRMERNPLKSRIKNASPVGSRSAPMGTPLSLAFLLLSQSARRDFIGVLLGSLKHKATSQRRLRAAPEEELPRRGRRSRSRRRAASSLRTLTGEGRPQDPTAPAMAIGSNPLRSTEGVGVSVALSLANTPQSVDYLCLGSLRGTASAPVAPSH